MYNRTCSIVSTLSIYKCLVIVVLRCVTTYRTGSCDAGVIHKHLRRSRLSALAKCLVPSFIIICDSKITICEKQWRLTWIVSLAYNWQRKHTNLTSSQGASLKTAILAPFTITNMTITQPPSKNQWRGKHASSFSRATFFLSTTPLIVINRPAFVEFVITGLRK